MIIARSVQVAAGPCLSFICLFWLCWVFTAAHVLSLIVAGGGGLPFVATHGLLISVASLVAERGLSGAGASAVVAPGLSSMASNSGGAWA